VTEQCLWVTVPRGSNNTNEQMSSVGCQQKPRHI